MYTCVRYVRVCVCVFVRACVRGARVCVCRVQYRVLFVFSCSVLCVYLVVCQFKCDMTYNTPRRDGKHCLLDDVYYVHTRLTCCMDECIFVRFLIATVYM
jgi:hypothetical protein